MSQSSPPPPPPATTSHPNDLLLSSALDTPPLPALYSPAPGSGYFPMSRSSSMRSLALAEDGTTSVPPSCLSPAFTPPTTTPGTPVLRAVPVEEGLPAKQPKLLKELPEVSCIVRARIPTTTGTEIFLHLYQNSIDTKEHLAIVFGNTIRSTSLDAPRPGETEMDRMIRGAYTGRLFPGRTSSTVDDSPASSRPASAASNNPPPTFTSAQRSAAPLVRIHSECYTGETAWSARCDCGEQLDEAARLMALDPAGGVVVYLRQEGRGIGLGEKLKAYNLQDLGNDTVQANLILRHPADARSYGLATAILKDLGLTDVRLLTNNPEKVAAVEGPGKECRVVERVPMIPLAWKNMKGGVTGKEVGEYLRTKITQMGHMLSMPAGVE